MELQNPQSGLTKEKLEEYYLSQGAGKPEQTVVAPIPGLDVENLSEEQIKWLVTESAAGHRVENILDEETGKMEPHVMMLSFTPHLRGGKAVIEKELKGCEHTSSGERTEVDIHATTICVLMLFCLQAPDVKQAGKDPLPLIDRTRRKMERKAQMVQRLKEKQICAQMKNAKTRREAARKRRQKKRKEIGSLLQEQNRDRQLDQAGVPASSEKETCLPKRRHKDQAGLPRGVKRLLMAASLSPGKRLRSDNEQKQAKKRREGGRADRSEVLHEAPQQRGGKRKPGGNQKSKAGKLEQCRQVERQVPKQVEKEVSNPTIAQTCRARSSIL